MAEKKSRIKEVVETVESWVGMGPKATKKKTTNAAAKKAATASPKATKKSKSAVNKQK